MKMTRCVGLLMAAYFSCASTRAVTIDWVTVGNAGNAPDIGSPFVGSVASVYRIGKYEVTAGQYTDFLNAVADADPNGLYNTSMSSGQGANIQRTGSSPNYSYSVAADWANRPVNFVSFWDAARFANWLHNNQPTGPQGPGTTEDGAYINVGDQTTFARQPGAKIFIPTEDEWYKAAYHDKNAGLAATYFDYPTGTNVPPGNDITEATNPGNNANYYAGDIFMTDPSLYTIGSPYYRTPVNEFELSDSPYGTFDQGGNVTEWNETKVIDSRPGLTISNRRTRGGAYTSISFALHASARDYYTPTAELSFLGFRVASLVPEPGSITLCLAGVLVLMFRRGKEKGTGVIS